VRKPRLQKAQHPTMSEKVKELVEIPQQFLREGNQVGFVVSEPTLSLIVVFAVHYKMHKTVTERFVVSATSIYLSILKNVALEFIQISKAVAIGFAVMGFIGYFVKLIHIPM
jgi:protein transport protein SEC61 subunit gamma-like protein